MDLDSRRGMGVAKLAGVAYGKKSRFQELKNNSRNVPLCSSFYFILFYRFKITKKIKITKKNQNNKKK